MELPFKSGLLECVAEGLVAGMRASEISIAYGIRYRTVVFYSWALRHPDRFRARCERMAAQRARDREVRQEKLRRLGVPRTWSEEWPPEDEQRLKQLLDARYSFAEIGRFMGRSRNAIAGKSSRLRKAQEMQDDIRISLMEAERRKLSTPA